MNWVPSLSSVTILSSLRIQILIARSRGRISGSWQRRSAGSPASGSRRMVRPGTTEVDIVAHSMGGLLARAWMANMTGEPYDGSVDRLVMAGTPNFGADPPLVLEFLTRLILPKRIPTCSEFTEVAKTQGESLMYGSQFLAELHSRWQRALDDGSVSPSRILTVVGCRTSDGACVNDRLVAAASALPPRPTRGPDYSVSYVARQHWDDMIAIDSSGHETYQMIKKFLNTGETSQPYVPTALHGLIVTPLEKEGTPYGMPKGVEFGILARELDIRINAGGFLTRALPQCGSSPHHS